MIRALRRSPAIVDQAEMRRFEPRDRLARLLHSAPRKERPMSFAAMVDRIRHDFNEMPELELTIGEAVRLWKLGADDCRHVLDSLADAGFLRWTPHRTIMRADYADIFVRRSRGSDISIRRR